MWDSSVSFCKSLSSSLSFRNQTDFFRINGGLFNFFKVDDISPRFSKILRDSPGFSGILPDSRCLYSLSINSGFSFDSQRILEQSLSNPWAILEQSLTRWMRLSIPSSILRINNSFRIIVFSLSFGYWCFSFGIRPRSCDHPRIVNN